MGILFLTKEARIYNGAKPFNKWCWENWTATCERMKLEHFLTPYTKITQNGLRLKCKIRKYKTLRGKHRTLDDINQSKILYDPPPRVMEIETKVNKWDLIKLKKFLHSKGNYKQGEKTALRMGENNSK